MNISPGELIGESEIFKLFCNLNNALRSSNLTERELVPRLRRFLKEIA